MSKPKIPLDECMIDYEYLDGYPGITANESLDDRVGTCFPHLWKDYRGLMDVFQYCEKCGVKQGEEHESYKRN